MTGRALPPTSPWAGDDGSPDPALEAALVRLGAGEDALPDVVAALASARVLVPVVATLDVAGTVRSPTGAPLTLDKEASAGVVALQAPDGRTALPVFSGMARLTAWAADGRPVPAEGPRAAASALAEGWELLVVDPAGPVTAVVPRPALRALATGGTWTPAVAVGAVRADVRDAVVRAGAGVPGVLAADAVPGRRAEVAVVLTLPPGLDRAGLDAVLAQVNARLAADPLVADAVDSLELRPVAARPPA